jgi:hypothetical protein
MESKKRKKKEKDESAGTKATQMSSTSQKLENKPMGSANAITAVNDFKGDGFWMVEEAVIAAPTVNAKPNPMLGAPDLIDNAPHQEGKEPFLSEEEWFGVVITPEDETYDRTRVKLYDSGATRHISPYKSDFTSYAPLSPRVYLNTTNQ